MSLAFCKECDHIVEGATVMLTDQLGEIECCSGCGTEVSGVPCEPEENPEAPDR